MGGETSGLTSMCLSLYKSDTLNGPNVHPDGDDAAAVKGSQRMLSEMRNALMMSSYPASARHRPRSHFLIRPQLLTRILPLPNGGGRA
jgi:hypothetical protein